jgi:hypothetical protein
MAGRERIPSELLTHTRARHPVPECTLCGPGPCFGLPIDGAGGFGVCFPPANDTLIAAGAAHALTGRGDSVFVPVLAVRAACLRPGHILRMRDSLKVGRIAAGPVVAGMVDLKAVRDWTVEQDVCDPVRLVLLAVPGDTLVAVEPRRSSVPAARVVAGFNALHKPCDVCLGVHILCYPITGGWCNASVG